MNFGEKYTQAVELIKEAYQNDKELVTIDGTTYPKEYLYALRMIEILEKFSPESSEEVFLAAWCQHFYRWDIPRNSYPMDRKGYHQWRSYLYTYQADKAAEVMEKVGYSIDSINKVKEMIAKKDIKGNALSQLLEDVVCLVFLNFYLEEFVSAHKKDEEKLIRIIKRTWNKMSSKGHEEALKVNFPKDIKALILAALN